MQRIITTPDLIAAIPGLIGFVPTESILLIGITAEKVQIAARHDITGAAEVADYITEVLHTNKIPTAIVVAITTDDETGDAAVRVMSDALMARGIETDRRIVVARCDQPAPYRDLITGDTGTSSDYRDSPASVGRITDGDPVAHSRDELRATLATTEPAINTEGIELHPELAAKAIVSAIVHWPTEVPSELSAQVAVMIRKHLVYRDALLRTAAYNPRTAAAVFTELSRPLRGRDWANVLTLAATCHYLSGNGAMTGIIFDHVTETTGGLPSLAQLLDNALRAGVTPDKLRDVIPDAATVDELFGGHFPTPEDFA